MYVAENFKFNFSRVKSHLNRSLKAVDHVQSEVRSGHNMFEDRLPSFLCELSSCRLTYENCNKSSFFLQLSMSWVDGLRKVQRYWDQEILLYKRIEVFPENFPQKFEDMSFIFAMVTK